MLGKIKKLASKLVAAVLIVGLTAAIPMTAAAADAVCSIGEAQYYDLESALLNVKSGETIVLHADITHNSSVTVDSKSITFDLNGKTLNLTRGLIANSGSVLLADPANGELNVSGRHESGNLTVNVVYGKVEVSNVTTSADGARAVYANGLKQEIIVYGDVTHSGAYGIGANAIGNNSSITIEGTLTVSPGVTYVEFHGQPKTEADYEPVSSKPGYFEYKATRYPDKNFVWVKEAEIDPCADGHAWDDGRETVAPTVYSEGVMEFRCKVCGEVDAVSIPKLIVSEVSASAAVEKQGGNQNKLTITVEELYSNGTKNVITATLKIKNNAAGTYTVGDYKVFVNTKGNDQIRACYIAE